MDAWEGETQEQLQEQIACAKISAEMKAYQPIPTITDFINEDGSDNLRETIEANYKRVKREVISLIDLEIERIKSNPTLCNLIKE